MARLVLYSFDSMDPTHRLLTQSTLHGVEHTLKDRRHVLLHPGYHLHRIPELQPATLFDQVSPKLYCIRLISHKMQRAGPDNNFLSHTSVRQVDQPSCLRNETRICSWGERTKRWDLYFLFPIGVKTSALSHLYWFQQCLPYSGRIIVTIFCNYTMHNSKSMTVYRNKQSVPPSKF